jgi:hypothetical protein
MTTRNLELQTSGRIRSDIELNTVIQELHWKRLDTRVYTAPLCSTREHATFLAVFHRPTSYILSRVRIKTGKVYIRL